MALDHAIRACAIRGLLLVALYYLGVPCVAVAQPAIGTPPGIRLLEEGVDQGRIQRLDCVGGTITCSVSGSIGTLTDSGAGGSSINSVGFLSTMGVVGTGTAAFYMVPGDVSASPELQTPVMGSTYRNLRCVADTTPGGTGITVTAHSGACAATELASSSLAVTVTTANAEVANVVNTIAPTPGQCVQFKVTGGSTTSEARVTCSVERSG